MPSPTFHLYCMPNYFLFSRKVQEFIDFVNHMCRHLSLENRWLLTNSNCLHQYLWWSTTFPSFWATVLLWMAAMTAIASSPVQCWIMCCFVRLDPLLVVLNLNLKLKLKWNLNWNFNFKLKCLELLLNLNSCPWIWWRQFSVWIHYRLCQIWHCS